MTFYPKYYSTNLYLLTNKYKFITKFLKALKIAISKYCSFDEIFICLDQILVQKYQQWTII